ncbi:MAG: glycosyltransferase family 39 protein [Endomicrobiaceae bacterium]|nr:glycosyltransferase family 39 protein [Endomicrobiaceae bacterium]
MEKFAFVFTKKFLFVFVIFVAFIIFFHRLSEAPLSGDGIGYGQIAKEMSMTGNYLTPYHDGVPSFYTSKPPMLYWMSAACGNILGFNNFSVKLPIAVLAFISIIAMFLFVEKNYDINTAFFTSIILIFTQQYMHHARSCVTDGPFSAFFIFALISFWIANTEQKNWYYYLMSFFIGCAIMTKQVSGLFICFVIFAYILFARDFKIFKNYHFYSSFLLIPIIVLPWHIIMYNKFGMRFINEYFLSTVNNIQGWSPKQSYFGGLYIYINILISNYQPWVLFFIYGLYIKFKNIKNIVVNNNKKDIFVLSWFLVPFIILHLTTQKNGNYLNPLYPASAIICAEVFNNFSQKIVKKIIMILILVSTILCVAYMCFPVIPLTLDSQKLRDPMGLIQTIKNIDIKEKIVIRQDDWFVFSSMFLFYADRHNITVDNNKFAQEIEYDEKHYFSSYKDDFMMNLLNKYKNKINILCETKRTILFTN